jgi:hypothetical protein
MAKKTKEDLNEKKRLNPTLRTGTWIRLELYAKANNIDTAYHSLILEKIIHDHCDHLNIADPFVNTHEN